MEVVARVLVFNLRQLGNVLLDLRVAVYCPHLADVLVDQIYLPPVVLWDVH